MRIYLVEPHAALRKALLGALAAAGDMQVVGASASAAQAVGEVVRLAPDAAVVGDGLSDGGHLALCRRLVEAVPGLTVILYVITEDSCDPVLAELFGAAGYVVKQVRPVELVEALRRTVRPSVGAPLPDRPRVRR